MGKRENFERFLKKRESKALLKTKLNASVGIVKQEAVNVSIQSAKMGSEILEAAEAIKKLDQVVIDNPSALIKYRQNITVPAVWLGEQGIRVGNIPQIPVEKVFGLKGYISENVTRIDGGDLDS